MAEGTSDAKGLDRRREEGGGAGTPSVADACKAFSVLAPLEYAEPWDNVGLLAGRRSDVVTGIHLAIDLTRAVVEEAARAGANLLCVYHPPIFDALKRIDGDSALGLALRNGMALYSMHTALDVAVGGTHETLCELLGIEDAKAVVPFGARESHGKLVVFVPAGDVDRVADALFEAGAGRIGNYSGCSFRSAGTGTFFGEAGTSPAVGERGRFERVEEVRLEVLVARGQEANVVGALRRAHPYEEPAFDLVRLGPEPPRDPRLGMGRIGAVRPQSRRTFIEHARAALGLSHVLVAGPTGDAEQVTRVACFAGSAGALLSNAAAAGAQVIVTGEVRHHEALALSERGVTVVATLHSNSERPTLPRLAARIASALPAVPCTVSVADRDPIRFV